MYLLDLIMKRFIFVLFFGIIIMNISSTSAKNNNPLLEPTTTQFGVPAFEKIKVEHFKPAFEEAFRQHNLQIEAIINNQYSPGFANTIEALNKQIEKNKDSSVFITFLDSTHSEYSWPKDFKAKFTPYVTKVNYISLSQSKKGLALLKNSYKNAINYIDLLFKGFLAWFSDIFLYFQFFLRSFVRRNKF